MPSYKVTYIVEETRSVCITADTPEYAEHAVRTGMFDNPDVDIEESDFMGIADTEEIKS